MAEDWEGLPDKPEEDWEKLPTTAPMSKGRAAVLGAASGATADFVDELGGALGKWLLPKPVKVNAAALEPQPGDSAEVATLKQLIGKEQAAQPTNYELVRDRIRAEQQQALTERPGTYIPAAIGGGLLASGVTGVAGRVAARAIPAVGRALANTAPLAQAGRGIAAATVGGGVQGIGASEGKTAGEVALDGLMGAGISGTIGAVPHLIRGAARLPGALRERAARGVATAEEDLLERARRAQERLEATARGTLGAETQKGSRQYENMLRYLNDPNGDPETKRQIQTWLQSDEGRQLVQRVVGGNLAEAPTQHGTIQNARQTLDDLVAARDTNIAADIAHGRDVRATVREQVAPRFATMGSRFFGPLIGAGLGALGGGEENRLGGIGAGGTLGTLAALTLGNPTTVMRNMVRAPSVRRAFWSGVERAATPVSNAAETLLELAGRPTGRALTQGAEFVTNPAARAAAAQTMGAAASASTLRDLLEQAEAERAAQGR